MSQLLWPVGTPSAASAACRLQATSLLRWDYVLLSVLCLACHQLLSSVCQGKTIQALASYFVCEARADASGLQDKGQQLQM